MHSDRLEVLKLSQPGCYFNNFREILGVMFYLSDRIALADGDKGPHAAHYYLILIPR
jgi:hypothetical protein